MIPDQVSEHTASNAERRLFGELREQLGDDWTVLHSLGVATHPRKPWAEIDFVLIGPVGVICLEVKGGRVRRSGGYWVFLDGQGVDNKKREGPFDQVGSASTALFNWLREHVDGIERHFVGFAVATPDSRWEVQGPDIVPDLVYDAEDARHPMSRYLRRVADYWTVVTRERFGRNPKPLDEKMRTAITDALRGDFDLRPSLRARVRNVTDDLLRLTQEQYRILDGLADNDRAIIRGGAGTGKTLLAVEETLRAAKNGKRVALLCSSSHLAGELRRAVDDKAVLVGHLHGVMADIVRRSNRMDRLPDASTMDLMTLFYPEQTLEGLADLDEMGTIDVLIVDEAQDLLTPGYLDVFDGLLDGGLNHGSWRMFLDPTQNLFEAMHTAGLQRLTDHRPAVYRLTVNCRNTEQIAVHTSLLADVDIAPVLRVEGDDVDVLWYSDAADLRRQAGRYVGRLLSGGLDAEDIVVLGRRGLAGSSVAAGLDIPFPLAESNSVVPDPRTIRYSTIAGFKGLEADAVVVVDVDDLLSVGARRDIYVASSRARAILAVFIAESARDEYRELARRFGGRLQDLPGDQSVAK